MIQEAEGQSFFQNKSSFVFEQDMLQPMNLEGLDEYEDDDDPGFDTFVVNEENFIASCEELADQYNFPKRAIAPDSTEQKTFREKKRAQNAKENGVALAKAKKKGLEKEDSAVLLKPPGSVGDKEKKKKEDFDSKSDSQFDEDDGRRVSILPKWIKFMPSNDEFYPAEFDKVIYDCYNLRVVFDREKTGFEETKDFPIVVNSIIAGRYQVVEYLGSAAFSKAIQCYDIHTE